MQAEVQLGLFSPFSHVANELISRLACWSLIEDEGHVEQSQGVPVYINQSTGHEQAQSRSTETHMSFHIT